MYMFDTKLDGNVVFNASDVNVLDVSKKDKKVDYYKVTCKGHFDYENVMINGSNKFKKWSIVNKDSKVVVYYHMSSEKDPNYTEF